METLSVFGLGKLGSTMLACFAHKGWNVIGVDINEDFIKALNEGRSPIYEPMVREMVSANRDKIKATIESEFAVLHSDASFIIVPTPSMEDGLFSTKYVEEACRGIAKALLKKTSYHVIIVTSTVLLGDMERIGRQIEEVSGKKMGKDFGLVYNPEFIALGKIVSDFLNPDMILIGESDKRAGDFVSLVHKKLVDNKPNVFRMNFYNAELTKISLNSYCTLKISYANSIAEICEKLPGGDAEKVLGAIGSDSRIGSKYFRGGLGWSGPCFPRDNRALIKTAEKYGVDKLFCKLTDEINNYHKTERLSKALLSLLEERKTDELAVLGLSYKENTPVIEESPAIDVIKVLSKKGIKISLYDPAAMENAEKELRLFEHISYADTLFSCIKGKTVCFIATPWDQFKKVKAAEILEHMTNPIILDAWGVLSYGKESGIDVRRIGKNYTS